MRLFIQRYNNLKSKQVQRGRVPAGMKGRAISCKVRVVTGQESLPLLLPALGHLFPSTSAARDTVNTCTKLICDTVSLTRQPGPHVSLFPTPTAGPLTRLLPGRVTNPCRPPRKRQDLSKEGEKQGPWHVDKEDSGLWLGAEVLASLTLGSAVELEKDQCLGRNLVD